MLIALGLGLIVGALLALTGAGGGILAVPLLVFGLQLGVARAGPIGLLAVGMAAALGAILGMRNGIVRYRAALLIAGIGMPLTPLGQWLAQQIDNRWLSVLFAAVLLFVAVSTYRQARAGKHALIVPDHHGRPCKSGTTSGQFIWTSSCARALILSGAAAGLLSGLLGVGGGFVMVPALQRYTNLEIRSIVATSLAVIALVSVSGVVASAATGDMAWGVALPFAAGALGGMLGGRIVAVRLAGPHMQIGFAALAGLVAIGMIAKTLF